MHWILLLLSFQQYCHQTKQISLSSKSEGSQFGHENVLSDKYMLIVYKLVTQHWHSCVRFWSSPTTVWKSLQTTVGEKENYPFLFLICFLFLIFFPLPHTLCLLPQSSSSCQDVYLILMFCQDAFLCCWFRFGVWHIIRDVNETNQEPTSPSNGLGQIQSNIQIQMTKMIFHEHANEMIKRGQFGSILQTEKRTWKVFLHLTSNSIQMQMIRITGQRLRLITLISS